MFRCLSLLSIAMLPLAAHATTAVPVSEPATLSLLALGVGAAAVLAVRKRRK
jgi:PEP-CTERM motif